MLESALGRLQADFGLTPVVACEIEFYLLGANQIADIQPFWADVLMQMDKEHIGVFKCEKEKGDEQFEIALAIAESPMRAASDIEKLKTIISEIATTYHMRADFSALPKPNQPGSGLHVHVHLADKNGKNVFYKDDERMSDALRFSIGGLLAKMQESMPVFAPTAASRARFTAKTNAPTTISWGANNRTVAVRLPDAPYDNKRIEHRVAGADADPEKVIAVILKAIHYGLTNKCDPGPQIYGDAADAQYHLPKLIA